jgi:hypothetical protein
VTNFKHEFPHSAFRQSPVSSDIIQQLHALDHIVKDVKIVILNADEPASRYRSMTHDHTEIDFADNTVLLRDGGVCAMQLVDQRVVDVVWGIYGAFDYFTCKDSLWACRNFDLC